MKRRAPPSFQRRLQLLFALGLGLTVLMMGATWIGYSRVILKEQAEQTLGAQADLIGAASRPAFLFADSKLADDLISKLKLSPDIRHLLLFMPNEKVLAESGQNQKMSASDRTEIPFMQAGVFYDEGKLGIYRQIRFKDKLIGVVYIESDLSGLHDSERAGFILVFLVMAISMAVGFFISMRLQKKMIAPLIDLARLTSRIGREKDYSLRATVSHGDDEIDSLISGFNTMTEEIESNFKMIEQQRNTLEESEQRFRAIAEALPLPMSITRQSDGKVLFINSEGLRFFGWDGRDVDTLHSLLVYQRAEDRQKLLQALSKDGELHGYELALKKLDGAAVTVALSMRAIAYQGEPAFLNVTFDLTERKTAQEKLSQLLSDNRRLTHTLMHVEEEERRYMSRELHDVLGQTLTAIKIKLKLIQRESREDAYKEHACEASEMVDQIFDLVRAMLKRLHPVSMDETGLTHALRKLLGSYETGSDLEYSLEINGDLDDLGTELKHTIYRIVQEGLTNITRHAQASRADVCLHRHQREGKTGYVIIRIEDDGKGMHADELASPGIGLLGMRERIHAAGGKLSMNSESGSGTCIRVDIPDA